MQFLNGPAVIDEVRRQPIKQLGVRRLFRHVAEVIRRGNNPGTEVVQPHAINHHARGQGIGTAGNRNR